MKTKIKTKIKAVGMIASLSGVTIITDKGDSVELKSSHYATHEIIKRITPILARRKVAEIDLSAFDASRAAEQKMTGVRFFRVLKSKVASLVGSGAVRELNSSYDDGMIHSALADGVRKSAKVESLKAEQIAKLQRENKIVGTSDTTMVAVVDGTPIVGVEALNGYIEGVARGVTSAKGFEIFMKRLATVVRDRKHTAQELISFLEKADLPIADDGCIIAYKALERPVDGVYRDLHSHRVPQKLGYIVRMDAEMVDDNRRVLCSNGFHVARRKYLTSFGTTAAITMIKIGPEHVISVPLSEPDKMRVSEYHIVAELTAELAKFIRSDRPMTQSTEGQIILGNVVAGNHIGVTGCTYLSTKDGMQTGDSETWYREITTLNAGFVARALDDVDPAEKFSPKTINEEADRALDEKPAVSEEIVRSITNKKPKKSKKQKANKSAAASGDLAAALSTEAQPAPPAKKTGKTALTPAQKEALRLVKSGVSKREAERKTGVSARSIGRLLSK